MDQTKIEAVDSILRDLPRSLLEFQGKVERDHVLEEVSCKRCGNVSLKLRRRCKDLLCRHCARGYRSLCKTFDSLQIVPSHIIHLILPYRPVALEKLRKAHLTGLQHTLAKFRDQVHFKRAIEGGYYHLELAINEELQVRLHAHLLVQTYQPAKSRPITREADKAWYRLTKQRMQKPISLTRYTSSEASKQFRYIAKSIRGERFIPILKALEDYGEEREGEYYHSAMQLRAFIVRKYNRVFSRKRKRAFFGSWRCRTGRQPITPGKLGRRCPCGLRA